MRAAKEVLDNPQRIFVGLRELNEGGWCYVGKPKSWFIAEDRVVPFPEDLVYEVFLNDRMSIFGWRAEKADLEDNLSPVGWKSRFVALAWKKTS